MNAKQVILEKIQDGDFALWTDREICKALKLGKRESMAVKKMLSSLCRAGELLCDLNGRYGTAEQFHAKKGVYRGNERGFGFFSPDDGSGDLFIPRRATCGALHGDIVLAYHNPQGRSDDEGEILFVLDHGIKQLTGTYLTKGRFGIVQPDESKFGAEIFIPTGKALNAKNSDKVVVDITSYSEPITGEITEILGTSGDLMTEELAIIRSHGLREEFPGEVLDEAEKAATKQISQEEIARRRDLRGELIITIDGEDTRDIDDAISVEEKDGKFSLGVHIADVTHYVRRAKALDKEAFARGTSVYFPDRVYPMLPKALSNGICSLNEGEDRLTLSALMTVDQNGKVLSKEIVPTVIRSRHRMTYTDVTKIIDGDPETTQKYSDLVEMIGRAAKLTKILQKRRKLEGSVELDIKEAKILYENGKIEVPDFERTLSHEMIEEFMVLANECVAEIMTEKKAPFVYRVHESPSPEKAREFSSFLSQLGIQAEFDLENITPKDYAALLKKAEGTPFYSLVNRVMLRSMMKAKYSPENIGHFGLASSCYCHFTSPIRRYPDLTIHRIIKDALRGESGTELKEKYGEFVKDSSERSSACERVAAEAERDVDDLYLAFYMQDKVGMEFDAILSGVTAQGLYAELRNSVEGFVALDLLPEDEYEFDEDKKLLRGRVHVFRLGDQIRVRVIGVDLGLRRTLFEPCEEEK